MFAKSGDQATRKQRGRRSADQSSFLAALWKNGIVRSTVAASATTALVATMMFAGGGFNPAVAAPIADQDPTVEQHLLDGVEDSKESLESGANTADSLVAEPESTPTDLPATDTPAEEAPMAPAEKKPAAPAKSVEPAAPVKAPAAPAKKDKSNDEAAAPLVDESADAPVVMAVPPAINGGAVITVQLRTLRGASSPSTVPASGSVKLRLRTGTSSETDKPGNVIAQPWATCTVDEDGHCSFQLPKEETNKYFWVENLNSLEGYYLSDTLITGENTNESSRDGRFGQTPYAFRTGKITAGEHELSTIADMPNQTAVGNQTMSTTTNRPTANRWKTTGDWPVSLANPRYQATCKPGLKVALVVDLSTSMVSPNSTGLNGAKQASKEMFSALAGAESNAKVDLFTFGSEAPAAGQGSKTNSFSAVPGNVGAFNSRINELSVSGTQYTNWDQGLDQVANQSVAYDLAVVLTDGNPTRSRTITSGMWTNFANLENAIFSANGIKAKGTQILTFGVGEGISGVNRGDNLAAVSGTKQWTSAGKIGDSDYALTDDWKVVASQLGALAKGLSCAATVTVEKTEISASGASSKGKDWEFKATNNSQYGKLTPANTQKTNADGIAEWNLAFEKIGETTGVSIQESSKPGWEMKSAVCTIDGKSTDASIDIHTGEIAVSSIGIGNEVLCKVVNEAVPTSLTVEKKWFVNGDEVKDAKNAETLKGATAEAVVTKGNSTSNPKFGIATGGYAKGDKVKISESFTAGERCVLEDQLISFGMGNEKKLGSGLEATLDAGENIATITNKINCDATLTLVKKVDNKGSAGSEATEWKLSATNSAGNTNLDKVETGTSMSVVPGTYKLSETGGPEGYDLTGLTCANGSQSIAGVDVANPSVGLEIGDNVTCTFTNSRIEYKDLSITKSVDVSFDRDYDWSIEKTLAEGQNEVGSATGNVDFKYSVKVDAGEPVDTNFKVSGSITVKNSNDIAIENVTLSDRIQGETCDIKTADGAAVHGPITVPTGDTTFNYTCDMPQGTNSSSVGQNTATASWDKSNYFGTSGKAAGSAGYDFSKASPSVTDGSITVSDDQFDLAKPEGNNVVDVDQSPKIFTYAKNWPGVVGECTEYDNTATFTEKDSERTGSDSEKVKLCIGAPLEVSKNVVSTFDRSYLWDITKTAKGEGPYTADPETGEVTVGYDVTVKPKDPAFTDSTWAMSGVISVKNPNDWQDITATVGDSVDVGGGAVCTVTGIVGGGSDADGTAEGFQAVIPKGKTVQFDYSCTFTGQPSYTGTNTATATWDASAASTQSGSAQGTAPVEESTWSQNPLNKTITVTDDEYTFDPAWVVTWSKDMAPQTRSYELTWTVEEAGTCQTFTNTAGFTGSNGLTGSDSADVEACRSADLSVSKTVDAAFDRTYLWGIEKSLAEGQDDTVTTGAGGEAEVDYDVTVTSQGYTDSNKTLEGRITVTNPNRFGGDTQVTVADQTTINGLVCTIDPAQDANPGTDGVQLNVPRATEAAGVWTNGTATVGYNCDASSVLEEDYTGNTNTATITWDEGRNTASSSAVSIDFTLGETTDETVEVFDNQAVAGGEGKLLGTVSWDEVKDKDPRSKTFPYTLTHTVEGGTCAPFTNTAWVELAGEGANPSGDAQVSVCSQLGLTAQKTANASFEREYFWQLLKNADKTKVEITEGSATFNYTVSATPQGFEDSNYALTGQITLVNPNRFAEGAITATVKDTVNIGGLTCVINAEDADLQAEGLQVVVPAASEDNTGALVLDYSCTGVPAKYTGTNVVDVEWDGADGEQSTSAQAPVNYLETASTNKTIEVTDDKVFDTDNPVSLGTAEWNSTGTATDFAYQLSFPGTAGTCSDYTNTAVIKGTETSDSETVTVCVEKELAVGIEASASFDRDHDWKVEKEADKTSFNVDGEGKVTAGYTVTATETGHTDSNWKLGGKITVTNPNGFGEILATIDTEPSLEGVTCTITDADADAAEGFQVLVPAGETKTLTYTCDVSEGVAEADYLDQTNVATATWAEGRSASSEPASFDFEMAGETDTEVTVTDDKYTENENVLGTATLAESPKTFTYDVEWEGVAGTCTTFTNTAVLAGDDDNPSGNSDSADIEVCVEKGLTVVKTVDAQYTRDYNWKVEKKADKTSFTVDGDGTVLADYTVTATLDGHTDRDWAMSGSIDVFNPNLQGEMAVNVADVAGIPGTVCTVAGGGQNVTVPAAMLVEGSVVPGKATVTYDCDLPETVDAADYEGKQNTATVTWTGVDGEPRTADFAADIEFKQTAGIDETVTVVDDKTVPGAETELGAVGLEDSPREFTYQVELAGDAGKCTTFTNTAVLGEESGADGNNTATADVEVCGKMGLGVSKTADASFDREYFWDLKKKVNGENHAEIGLDGAATFDYTVIATPDGYEDSNHSLTGRITLTNQNVFEGGGTTATVSDNVDIAGLTCEIDAEDIDPDTEGLQVLVPAGSTGDKAIVLDYSCDGEPENGDHEGLNTATATWTNVAGATDRAVGTASVTYIQEGEKNREVEVFDDKTNTDGEPESLGTATWNPEGVPAEFDYQLTFSNDDELAQDGTCKTYTNTATIPDADKSDSEDVEVCVKVGAPTAEKTVTGTTQDAEGIWTITYDLVVTGDATLLGRYSLEDTLRFGDGIEISSASWTGPVDGDGDAWDLPNRTEVLATDKLIEAGGTDTYTVTVKATVPEGVIGTEAGNCELAEGEDGTGFLNSATITANGKDAVSEDCATPVAPTFEKRAVELVQHNDADGNWDGTWDARYDLVVSNPGTNGQGVNYSLADSPEFAGGVVINDRLATTEDGTVYTAWNGKDSDEELVASGVELGAGETDTYRITVNVTLGADIATDERTCSAEGSEGGHGLLNSGRLTSGNESVTDEACLEIPAPEANVVKTATGATENPDGTWEVGYTIVVNNNSDVETRYDLTDTLRFGEGLDATEATWVLDGTDVQGAWEDPGTEASEVMAEGRILGARSSETYTVTVKVTPQEGAIGSDEATCDSGENPEDGGFLNEATLAYNGSTTASRDCTTPVQNPRGYSLEKTSDPASGETVWPGDEIDYTVTVRNTGEYVYTGAIVTDDMSGWEDAATLDEESLEVSGGEFTLEGSEIIWTVGDLAVGESKTLTYTVTVDDEAWDEILVNVATGNGDVPPATTEHPTPEYHKLPEPPTEEEEEPEPETTLPGGETEIPQTPGTATPVPPRKPVVPLAQTGASDATLWIVGGGAVVLLLGAGLLVVARRRRNEGN